MSAKKPDATATAVASTILGNGPVYSAEQAGISYQALKLANKNPKMQQAKSEIISRYTDKLAEVVDNGIKAQNAVLELLQDPVYLHEKNPADVAILFGVSMDKVIKVAEMLRALAA